MVLSIEILVLRLLVSKKIRFKITFYSEIEIQ